MKTIATALFGLFLLVQKTSATDYYIDAVNGSNSNSGLTPGTAFQTLSKVSYTATTLNPGDVVYLRAGTYGTTDLTNAQSSFAVLAITQSGTDGNPITFKAYPGESPLIQFNNWHGIYLQAAYIVIDGIRIRGASSIIDPTQATNQPSGCNDPTGAVQAKFNGNGIYLDPGGATLCHHITVRNCEVFECCGAGIGGTKNDYITIENNKVYGNAWYSRYGNSGISLLHLTDYDVNTATYRNVIRNNIVYDNEMKVPWYSTACRGFTDGNGIIIDDARNGQSGGTNVIYYGKTLIENNVVYNNGGRGIHVFVSDNVTIVNNTVYQNNKTGAISDGEITVMSTSASQAGGNKVYNNVMVARTGKKLSSLNNQTSFSEDYNIMFNSGSNGYFNTHDIYADPRFVNAAAFNFQLSPASQAINTGTNTTGLYSATDILDVVRPQGPLPDMGAYEFTGTVVSSNFTVGNIVALRAGDGSTALSANTANVDLLEYTTAGSATGISVALGNGSTASPARLTVGGAANTYEGQLSLSGDGRYLTAIGYDVAPGATSATALAADKVIVKVSNNGQTDFTTRFTSAGAFYYNGNNVRNVVTDNGGRFWTTGSGTGNTRYITAGSSTTSNNLTGGLRSVTIFNNRLYYAGAFADPGYATPDFPTSTVTFTSMPSIGTSVSYQSLFLFDLDPAVSFNSTGYDAMYLTDVSSGLRKFYWNGSAWTAAGIFNPASVTGVTGGLFSMTGKKDAGGNAVLYVIKGAASNNNLIQLTDAGGYNANISTTAPSQVNVANAGANYMFRGIAFSPSQTVVVLPVLLATFTASLVNRTVVLNWKTATEANAKEFIVEKSTDGIFFSSIGNVTAKNIAGSVYDFTDYNLIARFNTYRLKTVDNDGKTVYSNLVRIALKEKDNASLSLFPNPVFNSISINHAKAGAAAVISINAINGVKMATFNVRADAVQTSIDVSNLRPGAYVINYRNGADIQAVKFVKE